MNPGGFGGFWVALGYGGG